MRRFPFARIEGAARALVALVYAELIEDVINIRHFAESLVFESAWVCVCVRRSPAELVGFGCFLNGSVDPDGS